MVECLGAQTCFDKGITKYGLLGPKRSYSPINLANTIFTTHKDLK